MGRPTGVRIPGRDTFAFIAGEQLYRSGPVDDIDLFRALGKECPEAKDEAMQRAIQSGWLTVVAGGKINCGAVARAHYDELEGKTVIKPMGDVAAPRQVFNAFERPALSKKYIPNSRGTRPDVPDWSLRPAGFGFKSVGGGDTKPIRFPGKESQ